MLPEYQSRVLEDYQLKKKQNRLSYNLIALTPAKIKQECIFVFDRRFQKRDEKLLNAFFDGKAEDIDLRQAVRRCEADRFRPLIKFLNGRSKTTDEKNIELLAWLIDFEDRPFRPDYEKMYETSNGNDKLENDTFYEEEVPYKKENTATRDTHLPQPAIQTEGDIKENVEIHGIAQIEEKQRKEPISEKLSQQMQQFKKWYYIPILIFVLGGILVYLWKVNKLDNEVLHLVPAGSGTKQCMYWANDHYEQIYCNQRPKDVEVYAFDAQKAKQLKKITQPDTITLKALGRVWYVKIDGHVEYFTAAGFHPIHTDLRLKPLTVYIYNKYLFHYIESEKP